MPVKEIISSGYISNPYRMKLYNILNLQEHLQFVPCLILLPQTISKRFVLHAIMSRYMDYSYCCPTAQSVTASIYLLQREGREGERGVVACLHCRLIGIMRVKSLTASASGYSHFHLHCPFSSTFPFHALGQGWEEEGEEGREATCDWRK